MLPTSSNNNGRVQINLDNYLQSKVVINVAPDLLFNLDINIGRTTIYKAGKKHHHIGRQQNESTSSAFASDPRFLHQQQPVASLNSVWSSSFPISNNSSYFPSSNDASVLSSFPVTSSSFPTYDAGSTYRTNSTSIGSGKIVPFSQLPPLPLHPPLPPTPNIGLSSNSSALAFKSSSVGASPAAANNPFEIRVEKPLPMPSSNPNESIQLTSRFTSNNGNVDSTIFRPFAFSLERSKNNSKNSGNISNSSSNSFYSSSNSTSGGEGGGNFANPSTFNAMITFDKSLDGKTFDASKDGNIEEVCKLLDSDADPNSKLFLGVSSG